MSHEQGDWIWAANNPVEGAWITEIDHVNDFNRSVLILVDTPRLIVELDPADHSLHVFAHESLIERGKRA